MFYTQDVTTAENGGANAVLCDVIVIAGCALLAHLYYRR